MGEGDGGIVLQNDILLSIFLQPKKTPTKSRRPSAPALMKSPAAVRTHRRSRSGGGNKDLKTVDEEGATLDSSNISSGHDVNKYVCLGRRAVRGGGG